MDVPKQQSLLIVGSLFCFFLMSLIHFICFCPSSLNFRLAVADTILASYVGAFGSNIVELLHHADTGRKRPNIKGSVT